MYVGGNTNAKRSLAEKYAMVLSPQLVVELGVDCQVCRDVYLSVLEGTLGEIFELRDHRLGFRWWRHFQCLDFVLHVLELNLCAN